MINSGSSFCTFYVPRNSFTTRNIFHSANVKINFMNIVQSVKYLSSVTTTVRFNHQTLDPNRAVSHCAPYINNKEQTENDSLFKFA